MKWIKQRANIIFGVMVTALLLTTLFVQFNNGKQMVIRLGNEAQAAGTLDYTMDGTDDNVQVAAAVNALPATGGRVVLVSAVQVNFAAATSVTRAIPNVMIEGASTGTYFVGDGATSPFTAGGNGWVLSHLRVNVSTATLLAAMGATTGWSWEDVTTTDAHYVYRTPDTIQAGALVDSGLTSGRIPYAGTGGLLADSSNLTWSNSTGRLTVSSANISTLLMGDGFNLTQAATIYNLTLTPPDEFRIVQTNAYNAAAQYPISQIQQLSTGELAYRMIHSDDTAGKNWMWGQLGRTAGNAVHSNYYHWLDGQKVGYELLYASDNTAGRMLLGGGFWETTDPGARLEIRAVGNEMGLLLKGYTGQTTNYFQINNGAGGMLAQVDQYGSWDFNGHYLSRVEVLGLKPTTIPGNTAGYLYLSSANGTLQYYNGSAWKTLATTP